MINRQTFVLAVVATFSILTCRCHALGPYETHLATSKVTRVGLTSSVIEGKEKQLNTALDMLRKKDGIAALKKQGISNISFYSKKLTDKKIWYVVYFDYTGKDYLKAASDFEKAAPDTIKCLDPHPRAKTQKTTWLQMEWICYIRGVNDDKIPTANKVCIVTRIKPEKEQEYRTLHQTVWPGVIDQLKRSNNRNLSIFLVEIGEEIYEYLYLEYVGKDAEADGASSPKDPCTVRWWKLTDACQLPLPEVKEGIWAGMDPVPEKKKLEKVPG